MPDAVQIAHRGWLSDDVVLRYRCCCWLETAPVRVRLVDMLAPCTRLMAVATPVVENSQMYLEAEMELVNHCEHISGSST